MKKDTQSSAYDFRSAGKGSGKGKKLRSISVEGSDNGGATVRHSFHEEEGKPGKPPIYHRPEEFVFGATEGEKMHAHLAKHLKAFGFNAKADKKEEAAESKSEEAGESAATEASEDE